MGGTLKPQEQQRAFHAMGSPCLLRVAAPATHAPAARRALAAAEAEVLRIEQRYSRYRADSVVSRINAAAGSSEVIALDDETAALLRFAGQLHADSAGLFDISSGALRRVWNFKQPQLPSPAALADALTLVGWHQVEFNGEAIRLPRLGMEIDLGGFGKEYAADRAAQLLRESGLLHGYVNLGGDLRLLGPMSDGQPWRLGIAHPRRAGQVVAGLHLTNGALATSGDYERYFELGGQRYCHILNPKTGWPAQHWQSVSVVAPACLAAGALSTVAMLMGVAAPVFLQDQGVSWLAVEASGAVHSQGLGETDWRPRGSRD